MEGDIYSEEQAGIVPRSVKAILEQLEGSGAEFTVRVSFLELCKFHIISSLELEGAFFQALFLRNHCISPLMML
jgi:hypothetical protein